MVGCARYRAAYASLWCRLAHFRSIEPETRRCPARRSGDDSGKAAERTRRADIACHPRSDRPLCRALAVRGRSRRSAFSLAAEKTHERARGAELDAEAARPAGAFRTRHAACATPFLRDASSV